MSWTRITLALLWFAWLLMATYTAAFYATGGKDFLFT